MTTKKKVLDADILCWDDEGFPENCGIDVICRFNAEPDYDDENDEEVESALYIKPLSWFQRLTKAQLVPLRNKFLSIRTGILLASTAVTPSTDEKYRQDDEGAKVEVLLRKTGWKALSTTKNPNSGNIITLWEFKK